MKALLRAAAALTAAAVMLCVLSLAVSAQVISGSYDTIEYSLDTETFTLTLSGSGTVPYVGDPSLNAYRAMLREVVICDGLTAIEGRAFENCVNLTSATISDTVAEIGDDAFSGCGKVVIYCEEDSIAADYAKNNGIAFVASPVTGQYNLRADLDSSGDVSDQDAIYLLFHTFFPEEYPVSCDCDFDGDGEVTDQDAVYLLFYTFFPDVYPIN